MPSKTMKLFVVVSVTKAVQFSKRERVDGTDLMWGEKPYSTEIVAARTEDEVLQLVEDEDGLRHLIFEIADGPNGYFRDGESTDPAKA